MSSRGSDVDKVLVEENIKGYVRHWGDGVHSVWIRPSLRTRTVKRFEEELIGKDKRDVMSRG